jgi:ATP synthase F1 delta subunit
MNTSNKVVKTYAKSLFQYLTNPNSSSQDTSSFELTKITSSEQETFFPDVYVVGEELLLLRAILVSSKTIQKIFQNPTYSELVKEDILFTVFPGLTGTTKSFLKVLRERSHLSLIPAISEEFNELLLKFKKATKVNIIIATPLPRKFGRKILKALRTVTNSEEILVTIAYNPTLLGGVVIEYNSVAIDASVLKELSLFLNEI